MPTILKCPLLVGAKGQSEDKSTDCITTRCRLWNTSLNECNLRRTTIEGVSIASGSFFVQLEANPPAGESPDSVRVYSSTGGENLTVAGSLGRTWALASGTDTIMIGQMPTIVVQGAPATTQGALPAEEIWDNRAGAVFTYTGSNITGIEKTLPDGRKQTKTLTYDGSNNLISTAVTYT